MDRLGSRKCSGCGRTFATDVTTKFRCCGQPVRVKGKTAKQDTKQRSARMEHAQSAIRNHCALCEHFKKKNGKQGCELFRGSLCASMTAIANGDGCHNRTRPRFLPLEVRHWKRWAGQPSLDDHCIAVTSLAMHPHHKERQTICLESWKKFGLTIVSVNRTDEIDQLRKDYPQVDHWHANDCRESDYVRPTQRITGLANVATELQQTVLLVNSDIEIYGDQRRVIDPLADDKQIVGIRWNYDGEHYEAAGRERWGLDVFSISPAYAQSLPELGMEIGRPFWDYWIPTHSQSIGQEMHFIGERLFYHMSHAVQWTMDEWKQGERRASEHYGVTYGDWAEPFRSSLPFTPYEP